MERELNVFINQLNNKKETTSTIYLVLYVLHLHVVVKTDNYTTLVVVIKSMVIIITCFWGEIIYLLSILYSLQGNRTKKYIISKPIDFDILNFANTAQFQISNKLETRTTVL
jgi:hypothetical protein